MFEWNNLLLILLKHEFRNLVKALYRIQSGKDATYEGNRISSLCLLSQQYSDKDPTLIVTCIVAVKLLELIESRSRYRNNETRLDYSRISALSWWIMETMRMRGKPRTHGLPTDVGVDRLIINGNSNFHQVSKCFHYNILKFHYFIL